MKKVISLALVLAMLLTLCACSKGGEGSTTGSTAGSTAGSTIPSAGETDPTDTTASSPTEPTAPSTAPTQNTEPTETDPPATQPQTTEPSAAQPTQCSHTYAPATCTAPKTCTKCGATEGTALGHQYSGATCTAPGVCTVCGAAEESALGHQYADATCTAPKTCSRCGATEGEALGHYYLEDTCGRCGAVDPNYKPLVPGTWRCDAVCDGALYRFSLTLIGDDIWLSIWEGVDIQKLDEDFRNALLEDPSSLYEIDGVLYYCGAGDGDIVEPLIDINIVTFMTAPGENQVILTLERTGSAQYTVTAVSGMDTHFCARYAQALPVGSVFIWSEK